MVGRLARDQLKRGDREPNPASVEDVVQEVFIRLDRVVKKARLRNPEAMIVTLVGREAGSYRQKRPPVGVDIELAPAASPAPDPARTAELHERLRRLQKHLDGMDPADAQIILYLDVFEMTLERVAELQNRSTTAVFKHRERARRILHERLHPDGDGEPVSGGGGG
jgi:RNA polymerase sigma factor (sigma-70 family)